MSFLFVLVAATVSILVMFLITKLVGYRQISEICMYDYVNSITLGSIAADLAICDNIKEAVNCLIGMAVYGSITLILAVVTAKSRRARKVVVGAPIVLMEKGKLFRESFKKARLDLDEFLSMCRTQGYFDPSKMDTVLLEPNGQISVIPKPQSRPATPEDLKIPADREGISVNVIMDGRIEHKNLKAAGFDINWLKKELKTQGAKDEKEVFLASVDSKGTLNVFLEK